MSTTRQHPLLAVAMWVGVGIGLVLQPKAQAKESQSPPTIVDPRDGFCEEEKRFSEPWIQWASGHRARCLSLAAHPAERASCLESVRQELESMAKEHQSIYLSEMNALGSNHPVMQSILSRLREHQRFASQALEGDAETWQLTAARKESCLKQH